MLHSISRLYSLNVGIARRKWLPPPLRKLSQGKVEKGTPSTAPDRPTLKKTGSDKRFKCPRDTNASVATSIRNKGERICRWSPSVATLIIVNVIHYCDLVASVAVA
uniref:Uncharacterized protein n=1 Tax=Timema shepardi TaxID=629360 RepID=A0A7R9AMN6_TIMSH|nr:unnamed protein product [Timema shepardi]